MMGIGVSTMCGACGYMEGMAEPGTDNLFIPHANRRTGELCPGEPQELRVQSVAIDLDAIRVRVQGATEGPWWAWDRGVGWVIAVGEPDDDGRPRERLLEGFRTDIGRGEDARFIAAARTDVPALLEEIRRLRSDLTVRHELCWIQLGLSVACDRVKDHQGKHSWEAS